VLAQLRRGPLGLVELLQHVALPAGTNLLVLVDQFEEVFRYRRLGDANVADAFVALLLATAQRRDLPVFVAITMRSDFLGDCAVFRGLPEAIDDSQFLTPRLTREEMAAAISGPARVFGGDVEPALVNRLINDAGPDPDQLPVLQHALMRMWDLATRSRGPSGAGEPAAAHVLTLADYTSIGGLSEALSRHADEVFNALDPAGRRLAEEVFKCLTERSEGRRDTRRPASVRELAAVAGCTTEAIRSVVDPFRAPGACFLTPALERPLDDDTVVDISHESLIRLWKRMEGWVEAESRKAETYRTLKQAALQSRDGTPFVMTRRAVEQMQKWKTTTRPTPGWAARYAPVEEFDIAMSYLAAAKRRNLYKLAAGVGAGLAVVGVLVYNGHQRYQTLAEQAVVGKAFQQALDSVAKVDGTGDAAVIAAAEAACVKPLLVDTAVRLVVARQMADRSEVARVRSEGELLALGQVQRGPVLVTMKADAEPNAYFLDGQGARFPLSQAAAARGLVPVNGVLSAQSNRFALLSGAERSSGILVQVWDLGDAGRARVLPLARPAARIAIEPTGRRLAAVEQDGTIWLYELGGDDTGGASARLPREKLTQVDHVQFSADGTALLVVGGLPVPNASGAKAARKAPATADYAMVVKLEAGGGVRALRAKRAVPGVFGWQGALSADASTVVTLNADGVLGIWDLRKSRLDKPSAKQKLNLPFPKEVAFFPDGKHVALTSHTGRVSIVSLAALGEVPLTDNGNLLLRAVPGLDPKARQLLVQRPDATYQLLDLVDQPLDIDPADLTAASFTPDGSYALLGDSRGHLRAQRTAGPPDPAIGTRPATRDSSNGEMEVTAIAGTNEGTFAVTGHRNGHLRFWRHGGNAPEYERAVDGKNGTVQCVAFDRNGTRLVSAADDVVSVWEVSTGQRAASIDQTDMVDSRNPPHKAGDQRAEATQTGRPLCAAFESDGRSVLILTSDGGLWRWDWEWKAPELRVKREGQIPTTQSIELSGARFSQDRKIIAAVNNPSADAPPVVLIWNRNLATEAQSLPGQRTILGIGQPRGTPVHLPSAGEPPRGTQVHLASADDENRVTIWDVSGHAPLPLGARTAKTAALSGDGTQLLVVGDHATSVFRCQACESDAASLATEHALRTMSSAPGALALLKAHPCLAGRLSARMAAAPN
jgi:WD40 repeat protein